MSVAEMSYPVSDELDALRFELENTKAEYESHIKHQERRYTSTITELEKKLQKEKANLTNRKLNKHRDEPVKPRNEPIKPIVVIPKAQINEEINSIRNAKLMEMERELKNEKSKAIRDLEVWASSIKDQVIAAKKGILEEELNAEIQVKREKRLSDLEAELRIEAKRRKKFLDEWMNEQKQKTLENYQIGEEIDSERSRAIQDIFEWGEREKERLQNRFESEYERTLEELKDELKKNIHKEFSEIHQFFYDFIKEKQSMAEHDLKSFLDKKIANIVNSIVAKAKPK